MSTNREDTGWRRPAALPTLAGTELDTSFAKVLRPVGDEEPGILVAALRRGQRFDRAVIHAFCK